jgi:hypothetical protein
MRQSLGYTGSFLKLGERVTGLLREGMVLMQSAPEVHPNNAVPPLDLSTPLRLSGCPKGSMGSTPAHRPVSKLSALLRLDPDRIVNRIAKPLLASQIALGCLDTHVPKQELDLLKFATTLVA